MFNPESLKTIVDTSGLSFKENAVSYIFECPFCHKRKLYVHKVEGHFCCFKCKSNGFKGRAEYALSELLGAGIEELKQKLYSGQEIKFDKIIDLNLNELFDYEESAEFAVPDLPEMVISPNFVNSSHPSFTKAYNYLVNVRGLTEKHIETYDIHYSPSEQCVVFPVKIDNVWVGWQLRHIEKNIKLTSKGLDKTKCLMFQDRLINSEHCVLAEGPISTIKAHLIGGNVASMGKDVSDTQLDIIKHKVEKLYLALDPDAASVTDRICKKLFGEMEVYLLEPAPGYGDLGEMPQELVFEQFKNAKKASGKSFFFFKNINEMVF